MLELRLLAALALHAPGPVPTERLVDLVWDDDPPAAAATLSEKDRSAGLPAGRPRADRGQTAGPVRARPV
jgi:hypothetical protein